MHQYYQDLEYEKIRRQIAQRCHSLLGQDQCRSIQPLQDKSAIERNLNLNHEIQVCTEHGVQFSFAEIVDIRLLFEEEKGAVFGFEEFRNVYYNVACANQIHTASNELKDYHLLYKLLTKLHKLPEIAARFNRIFDFEGNVLDGASPELQQIRRQMSSLQARISRTMQNLLQDAQMSNYLQDKFVTQRNDRYVIPIKESAAPYVRGIVQSKSATKSTVFIEPESVVPLSNELQLLRQEEKNEIYRIFLNYTAEIRAFSAQIISNTVLLGELDMRFAIGKLGLALAARVPQISTEPCLELVAARHPLLILKLQDIHKVIPYDLNLGVDYNLLVLSGPNTGGKTVLLKSVGLITLMALSGIPVPLSDQSRIGIFSGVFADIGDDQSIENALSTFSSHLDKIGRMLKHCDPNSLILIDEIGAATDPQQGSALAQVILERFSESGAKGIVTTHYTALKVFAEQTDNCINASMQFDLKALTPTYKFVPGFPGDSFAIEVASALGLDDSLISRAKELCGSQSIEFVELLKTMQAEKKKLAREHYEYELKNRNLQARIDELNTKNAEFEKELKSRKQQFLKEQQQELIALQKAYTAELNEIRSLDKEERKHHSESRLSKLQDKQKEITQTLRQLAPQNRDVARDPRPGDKVWLADFEADAVVLSVKDGEVLVDMNGISFKTHTENIYASKQKPKEDFIPLTKARISSNLARREIKLLGLTFDEAQPIIDEAIDEAIVAGIHSLRIVHGKGTGALRTKVRDYLGRKKQVISISTPPPALGGSGVTIANV